MRQFARSARSMAVKSWTYQSGHGNLSSVSALRSWMCTHVRTRCGSLGASRLHAEEDRNRRSPGREFIAHVLLVLPLLSWSRLPYSPGVRGCHPYNCYYASIVGGSSTLRRSLSRLTDVHPCAHALGCLGSVNLLKLHRRVRHVCGLAHVRPQ